ncbi:MAG TPA: phosphate-starvation-inducible PsiE family protein, partial [Candidatus Cloacimonadota bacterium]|nr:phosphate-starvation-inducible PsiE family protein [Candidatus Cloacimonadota bacterium]
MLESKFMKFIEKFEMSIVVVLMILMVFTVLISSVELGVLVIKKLQEYPRFFIGINSLLEIFGQFLIVLIGIELL